MNRPAALMCKVIKRRIQGWQKIFSAIDVIRRYRNGGHHCLLGGQFVQIPQTSPQTCARVYRRNYQHRAAVGAGLCHGGQHVGQPRTSDHERNPGNCAVCPPGTGITIGHKPRSLFVARGDMADRGCRKPAI